MTSPRTNIYDIVDGRVRLHLHPGQSRAWLSMARYIMILAGTQGGKTSFGPWWLEREIRLKGRGDYIAVAPSYDLFKLKMLPEIRTVFEHVLQIGRYWSGDKILEIVNPDTREFMAKRVDDPMWARIILRSASAEGGLESATAKAAWLDELGQDDFSIEAWQAVERRVTLNRGRILGTTTPYNLGWLKQVVIDPAMAGDPNIEVISFASTMNPLFSIEEFEAARLKLPDWKFRMFYMGEFTKPAGMIYSDFRNWLRSEERDGLAGHKVKPFEIPNTWRRVIGVDPGGVNTAKIFLAQDPSDKTWYIYRSVLNGNKSTQEHALEMTNQLRVEGAKVSGFYIGSKSEIQIRMDYQMAGVSPVYEPPVADVEAGIDRVISLMKTDRLFIFDNQHELITEISGYSRVTDGFGNVMEQIKDQNKYHRLDSLRYAAAGASRPVGVGFF